MDNLKPKKRRNVWMILVLIFFLAVVIPMLGFFWIQRDILIGTAKNAVYARGPLDMRIIANLQEAPTGLPFLSPLMSWNDNKYGRIYAQIFDAPDNMSKCGAGGEGGVIFFDSAGNYFAKCNSGWDREGMACNYLNALKYSDADYISEPCKGNITDPKILRAIDIAEEYFFIIHPPKDGNGASKMLPNVMSITPGNSDGDYTVVLQQEISEIKLTVVMINWQPQLTQ